ncbi:MAG TPA: hypothetical protein VNO30_05005 [Kofleriaceae bacterium]|nr:hypothetical protein [Kofleriaceae bacterium]
MTRRALALALALAAICAALAAGCNPVLVAQSAAPPGRAARLDEVTGFWGIQSYRLELSQGVAIALTCHRGGPCEQLSVVSDDPAVAEVRRASLGVLEKSGLYNQATSAAVVIVGRAPGATQLHVRSKEGGRDIAVRVIPPPGPITVQATSR